MRRCSTKPRTPRRACRDHISGPRAVADPIADITDVYAFPSPDRPGQLVLVLNTLPFAPPTARFSDALLYRFRLRALTRDGRGDRRRSAAGDGRHRDRLRLLDARPRRGEQHCTCTLPGGDTVTVPVGDDARRRGDGARVFAGPRWDPFILDAPAMLKTIATGRLAFTDPGAIYLDGKNVLSLVVELDCAGVLGDAQLVGVAAETLTRGKLNVRLERVGRPEVKNMMLGPTQFDRVNRDLEIRDLYNMEDAFHPAHVYEGAYRARLNANLAFWDGLDGKVDWPLDDDGAPSADRARARGLPRRRRHQAVRRAGVLPGDRARRPRAARAHETCGGRALNDDVMDTLFTLLINGGQRTGRSATASTQPTRPALADVPVPRAAEPRPARARRRTP